jgi:hypothetical protein
VTEVGGEDGDRVDPAFVRELAVDAQAQCFSVDQDRLLRVLDISKRLTASHRKRVS